MEKKADQDERPTRLEDLRIKRVNVPEPVDSFRRFKKRIHDALLQEIDRDIDVSKPDEVRHKIETMFDEMLVQENLIIGRADRQRLLEQIVAEIMGLGPIEPLLADDSITEVMVNLREMPVELISHQIM